MGRYRLSFVFLTILTLSQGLFAISELRMGLRFAPRTFDPARADDEASGVVRYLTGGVLVRFDRQAQTLMPELAVSWRILEGGRTIRFKLRKGIRFSDGSPFGPEDVAYTMRRLLDPALESAIADQFRAAHGMPDIRTSGDTVEIRFSAPLVGLDKMFDEVAILSASGKSAEGPVLGPFVMQEYRPGDYVLLRRNPEYWRYREGQTQGPDTVRLVIQQDRDVELARFLKGEFDLINSVDPENYERILRAQPGSVIDAGPSLDSDFMWFNQSPKSPMPAWEREWFASRAFRNAVSEAIHRDDLVRIAFLGHAQPAVGPASPGNVFWFNHSLQPHRYDPQAAMSLLRQNGFQLMGGHLTDSSGHPVRFSIITNAGNKAREKMALLIQQDLLKIGIEVKVVTLDFPSLLERISRNHDYEACILGFTNVEVDPMGQMNVWISSSVDHQWNPEQKSPATAWEAEVDDLMRKQASTVDPRVRKRLFDRVQQIVRDQEPFIYLVNKHSLSAISPAIGNPKPARIWPQTFWNAYELHVAGR